MDGQAYQIVKFMEDHWIFKGWNSYTKRAVGVNKENFEQNIILRE